MTDFRFFITKKFYRFNSMLTFVSNKKLYILQITQATKFEVWLITKSRVGESDRFLVAENESGRRISPARQIFE